MAVTTRAVGVPGGEQIEDLHRTANSAAPTEPYVTARRTNSRRSAGEA
jgi:hypothetical protein